MFCVSTCTKVFFESVCTYIRMHSHTEHNLRIHSPGIINPSSFYDTFSHCPAIYQTNDATWPVSQLSGAEIATTSHHFKFFEVLNGGGNHTQVLLFIRKSINQLINLISPNLSTSMFLSCFSGTNICIERAII